jgi:hypothetical protein
MNAACHRAELQARLFAWQGWTGMSNSDVN